MSNEHWTNEQIKQFERLCDADDSELTPLEHVGFHLDYLREHLRDTRAGEMDMDKLSVTIETTHEIAQEHRDCQVCSLLNNMARRVSITTLAEFEGPLREAVECRFFNN